MSAQRAEMAAQHAKEIEALRTVHRATRFETLERKQAALREQETKLEVHHTQRRGTHLSQAWVSKIRR